MPSIPGLNTRETAIVVWAFLIIAYAAVKSGGFRSSAGSLLKIVFGSVFLTSLIVGAVAYTTVMVLVLKRAGYWDSAMENTTVLWFLGTALVTAFSTKRKDGRYFLRLVVRNLSAAAVIDYLVNIHPFSLYVWLVLVPIALLFAGVEALAQADSRYAGAEKLSRYVLNLIGLVVISFSVAYVVRHFDKLATVEKAKDFLLPLLLTVSFIPFLYTVALIAVYQTMLAMIRFRLHDNDQLYRFARREVMRACGLSLGRAQLFEERFTGRLWGAMDEADVLRVVDEFRDAWQVRRSGGESSAAL